MKAKMSVEGTGREEDPKGRGAREVGPKRKFPFFLSFQPRQGKEWRQILDPPGPAQQTQTFSIMVEVFCSSG